MHDKFRKFLNIDFYSFDISILKHVEGTLIFNEAPSFKLFL